MGVVIQTICLIEHLGYFRAVASFIIGRELEIISLNNGKTKLENCANSENCVRSFS